MMITKLKLLIGLVGATLSGCNPAPPNSSAVADQSTGQEETKLWVTSQHVDRRTCPSTNCGVVGRLFFREGATPLERRDGWVRTTQPYDASCSGGRSEYVDEGNSACTTENGIVDGRFAEWIEADDLSIERPADPALTASADELLVAESDDFDRYRREFVTATRKLIDDGRCSAADFEEMGGWVKATGEKRNQPIYFTYCGGMTVANRLYLNAQTGEVYR